MRAKAGWIRLLVGGWLLGAVACSSMRLSVDSDPKTDFARLRTFGWMEPTERAVPNAILDDPFLDAQIRAALESELVAKGLKKVDAPAGDLLVGYQTALRRDLDVKQVVDGYAYRPVGSTVWPYPHGTVYVGGQVKRDEMNVIRKGSLVVQMAAGEPRTIVWRGLAEAELPDQPMNSKDREQKIRKAVKELLGDFPPKPQ